MSLTAPVSYGQFHYSNGDFYAESSGANRHRRATASELNDLFHPPKKTTLPPRDPPAHWYEAQLIHYGLPPTKSKGTAVKRLLDAVNSRTLIVPPGIVSVEKDLKKKWDANERKAKKEAVSSAAKGAAAKGEGKKRKAEDMVISPSVAMNGMNGMNGMNVNFTFNMAGMTGAAEATAATKKPKKALENSLKAEKQVKKPKIERPQTAIRSGPKAEVGTQARKPKVKTGPKAKPEPANPFSTPRRIKDERNSSPPHSSPQGVPLGLINGTYHVTCNYVSEQWNCEDLRITIAIDDQRVWGSYDFEMFSGVFLVDERPYRGTDQRFPLRWRGREHGEGQMSYGNNNQGWISFLGGGRIEGCLKIMGDFEFEGIRDTGLGPGRNKRDLMNEWEGYNEDAYEYERVNRW